MQFLISYYTSMTYADTESMVLPDLRWNYGRLVRERKGSKS